MLGTGLDPVHPLVNLSALEGVSTEERGVAVGEVLSDSMGLGELALGSLEERELVGGVESLVGGLSAGLIRVDDDLELLVVHLGGDDAHVDEDVACVLGVDFLKANTFVNKSFQAEKKACF